MDETKETQKDSLPKGQTSEGNEGITSKAEPKSYTEEEVNKRVSDALAAKGRDAKSLTDKEASLKAERETIEAEKAKIADWQRQRDEAELAEARRDPDKLATWQKKQNEKTRDAEFTTRENNLKKREADLTKREAEYEAGIKALQEADVEKAIFGLAVEHGVDAQEIKDTMDELKLTTVEQAKAVAKRLGTLKRPATEAEGIEKEPFNPISGVTSGTRGTLTPEQFEKLPIEEKKKYLQQK